MQRILSTAALAATLALTLNGCSSTVESNLVGNWKGVDSSGTEAMVSFKNGRKLEITSGEQQFLAKWEAENCRSPMKLQVYPEGESKSYIPMLAEVARDGTLTLTAGSDLKFQPTQVAQNLDQFSARLERSRRSN